jgi:hypothetical protein
MVSPMLRTKLLQVLWTALLVIAPHLIAAPYVQARITPAQDPLALYGKEITFNVIREGERVGRHTVAFTRASPGDLNVTARLELEITFLTIPFYEFLYRSSAVWRDGRLTTLFAQIDDNGKKSTIRAIANDRGVRITGPKGLLQSNAFLYPTNHWNAGVLSQSQVLNTLNGDISQVQIAATGRERILAQGTWVQATRYQYSGDIDTTVWYDDAGRWVKMRFTAKGGSVIEYQCARCGLDTANKAATD